MSIDLMSDLLYLIAACMALLTLPGSYLLARWTWAARQASQPISSLASCEPILLLIPAHNESATLRTTLPLILAQAHRDLACQVVVIADNCTDDTAALAQHFGAQVIIRNNLNQRGKGYALQYAFSQLPNQPWYLIVDADSTLDEHFLSTLRQTMHSHPAAIQTRYLAHCTAGDQLAPLKHWALQAFNINRQRARARLGESASILGNGFVLAGSTLTQVPFQAGSIVEDLEYQLALQTAHLRIVWLEDVAVYGEMPQGSGEQQQRARWEGGRLAMLRQHARPLLKRWLAGEQHAGAALQDLILLPLSWHACLLIFALPAGGVVSGIALLGLLILGLHVLQALFELPTTLRWAAVRCLPKYMMWKLMCLPAILSGSRDHTEWQRSTRHAERSSSCQREP